jgi:dolichyl-phosphate beta-glucosyltransferase
MELSVIIPAYNEEKRLPGTLSHAIAYLKAQPYRSEIIVVDDGSVDGTGRVALAQDAAPATLRLLRHPDGANHGKGASVKRGILEAEGNFRLFMDADNSTTLDQIENFWPLFASGCDIVIGSRALRESVIDLRQSRRKEMAGRFGNWLVRMAALPGISDTQAGFKMFSAKVAERIFPRLTIDRWGYDIELLVIARALGYRICEAPITWLNASGSKVTLGSYFEVLGEIWRIRRNLRAGRYK